ncbi:ZrgA family zinc uptake protein [Motilimonas eburnea]|uniref:ZrgA family zinc uptake protein n=1 Tax=Motilimonas eburnea TaxID=1737488 RepID=UPI001E40009D|nr:DUF2796 domain-containing protein [Motilimonas eburnea]MCE2571000.1 DUF2796 domain-containing protein [Motilimonas eburnea]
MKFQPHLLSASLIALSTFSTSALSNETEHRAHGSHEHGSAKLNVILAGEELAFEWVSPAANLLGFEHQAKTDEQRQKVNEVVALLKNADNMINLPASANCTLASSNIDSDILVAENKHQDKHANEHEHDHEHEHEHENENEDDHKHKHEDKHADEHEHDHEHEHEHENDHEHEHEHEDKHEHEGEHKHEGDHEHEHDHDHDSAHADITVSYLFTCRNPGAITQLPVTLFKHFPLTEKIQVQGIMNETQMATNLSPDNDKITW